MARCCKECFSKNVLEVKRDGDLICGDCGLVLESHMIDFSPVLDTNNVDHYDIYNTFEVEKDLERIAYSLDIPENTLLLADHYFKETSSTKGQNRQATIVSCMANACRDTGIKRSMEVAYEYLNVDTKKVNKAAKTVNKCEFVNDNIRKRFAIHSQKVMDDERMRYKILKKCEELEHILRENKRYMNTKPSKMDAVLFYHVAQTCGVKIAKKDILNLCGLSNVTFNKHLSFLISLKLQE